MILKSEIDFNKTYLVQYYFNSKRIIYVPFKILGLICSIHIRMKNRYNLFLYNHRKKV